ncbi:response regulator transcription factor [Marinomonas sp.]
MTENILIIEDDLQLSDQIAQIMQAQGFKTKQEHNGKQGLITALRNSFDLILLDVQLPHLDGFALLERFRRKHQTPVIMITGRNSQQERILGYGSGADDYIAKPFNATELVLRIHALLKRTRTPQTNRSLRKEQIQEDQLLVCREKRDALVMNEALELTDSQFRLLWELMENKGEVLSKLYLYKAVLNRDYSRFDRSLDMHMSRIRQKLLDAGISTERFTTVHGKGYLFR